MSIVHVMGGLAGYVGTWMIGPRIGLYKPDQKLAYILEDEKLIKQIQENENLEEDKIELH